MKKLIYLMPTMGVFGVCPPCVGDDDAPNYLCDPCDTTVFPGGIIGFAAKKCTYTFADVTDEAEWVTAIANKDVILRINGSRILGQMPTPNYTEKVRGSCVENEVVKQVREVTLEDVENDVNFSIDDLYNFFNRVENRGKYEFGFITCDLRLIGETDGFYSNVSIKGAPEAPQTNEDDFKWVTVFTFKETPGYFYQVLLDFLSSLATVCWVETITVSGAGGAITVAAAANLQMSALVVPANATLATVTWSVVPGTGTASIDAAGLLTGGTAGTVTVVATADDASGVTGTLEITVTP